MAAQRPTRQVRAKTTTMTLLEKLRALRETEAKATEAPWTNEVLADGFSIHSGDREITGMVDVDLGGIHKEQDGALITDSRNLLPALLALVEAQHEALHNLVVSYRHQMHNYEESSVEIEARAALALATQPLP